MRWAPLPPTPNPNPWIPSQAAGGASWFSDADLAINIDRDTNGVRTTFSTLDQAYTFTFDTAGSHTAIGSTIGRTLQFNIDTNGVRTRFGVSDVPLTFTFDTAGAKVAFGSADQAFTVGIDTAGTLIKRGSVDTPISFNVDSAGKVTAKSTVDLPITFTFDTTGTGGEVAAQGEALKVDEERLKREPWPRVPKSPRPGYRPFKDIRRVK